MPDCLSSPFSFVPRATAFSIVSGRSSSLEASVCSNWTLVPFNVAATTKRPAASASIAKKRDKVHSPRWRVKQFCHHESNESEQDDSTVCPELMVSVLKFLFV